MAVAFSSATLGPLQTSVIGYNFAYSHSGNALCIFSFAADNTNYNPLTPTITYGSGTFTSAFAVYNGAYDTIMWSGLYLLNAAASGTMTVSFADYQDVSLLEIISVSGASTTTAPTSNYATQAPLYNDTFRTVSTSVTSAANNLVVGASTVNSDLSYISSMNGTYASTPFWYNYLAGSSPTATVSATWYDDSSASATTAIVGGFSFAPSAGPTPHAYVGFSGVANQVQTMPGCASGVVANASSGYGDDVAGSGVVDVFFCNEFVIPTTPSGYILMEGTGYVLQESSSKIYMEQ